jgi:hypothetical protein
MARAQIDAGHSLLCSQWRAAVLLNLLMGAVGGLDFGTTATLMSTICSLLVLGHETLTLSHRGRNLRLRERWSLPWNQGDFIRRGHNFGGEVRTVLVPGRVERIPLPRG